MGNFFKEFVAPALGGGIGFLIGGPKGAAIGAGLGLSHHSAQEAARGGEEANALNMYLAHHQYEMMMNDLRRAGLNPILAAGGGFNPGSHQFQNPYSQSSQIMSNMAQSAIASGTDVYRAQLEGKRNPSTIAVNNAAADLSREKIWTEGDTQAKLAAEKLESWARTALYKEETKLRTEQIPETEARTFRLNFFNRLFSDVDKIRTNIFTGITGGENIFFKWTRKHLPIIVEGILRSSDLTGGRLDKLLGTHKFSLQRR